MSEAQRQGAHLQWPKRQAHKKTHCPEDGLGEEAEAAVVEAAAAVVEPAAEAAPSDQQPEPFLKATWTV